MVKLACYIGVILISAFMLNIYAGSDLGKGAAGGSYLIGLQHAFMAGFGNTVAALAALAVGIIGLGRSSLSSVSGSAAWATGKLFGIIVFFLSLFAVFINGVTAYMKLGEAAAVYVSLTGPVVLDIANCVLMIIGFFASAKKAT